MPHWEELIHKWFKNFIIARCKGSTAVGYGYVTVRKTVSVGNGSLLSVVQDDECLAPALFSSDILAECSDMDSQAPFEGRYIFINSCELRIGSPTFDHVHLFAGERHVELIVTKFSPVSYDTYIPMISLRCTDIPEVRREYMAYMYRLAVTESREADGENSKENEVHFPSHTNDICASSVEDSDDSNSNDDRSNLGALLEVMGSSTESNSCAESLQDDNKRDDDVLETEAYSAGVDNNATVSPSSSSSSISVYGTPECSPSGKVSVNMNQNMSTRVTTAATPLDDDGMIDRVNKVIDSLNTDRAEPCTSRLKTSATGGTVNNRISVIDVKTRGMSRLSATALFTLSHMLGTNVSQKSVIGGDVCKTNINDCTTTTISCANKSYGDFVNRLTPSTDHKVSSVIGMTDILSAILPPQAMTSIVSTTSVVSTVKSAVSMSSYIISNELTSAASVVTSEKLGSKLRFVPKEISRRNIPQNKSRTASKFDMNRLKLPSKSNFKTFGGILACEGRDKIQTNATEVNDINMITNFRTSKAVVSSVNPVWVQESMTKDQMLNSRAESTASISANAFRCVENSSIHLDAKSNSNVYHGVSVNALDVAASHKNDSNLLSSHRSNDDIFLAENSTSSSPSNLSVAVDKQIRDKAKDNRKESNKTDDLTSSRMTDLKSKIHKDTINFSDVPLEQLSRSTGASDCSNQRLSVRIDNSGTCMNHKISQSDICIEPSARSDLMTSPQLSSHLTASLPYMPASVLTPQVTESNEQTNNKPQLCSTGNSSVFYPSVSIPTPVLNDQMMGSSKDTHMNLVSSSNNISCSDNYISNPNAYQMNLNEDKCSNINSVPCKSKADIEEQLNSHELRNVKPTQASEPYAKRRKVEVEVNGTSVIMSVESDSHEVLSEEDLTQKSSVNPLDEVLEEYLNHSEPELNQHNVIHREIDSAQGQSSDSYQIDSDQIYREELLKNINDRSSISTENRNVENDSMTSHATNDQVLSDGLKPVDTSLKEYQSTSDNHLMNTDAGAVVNIQTVSPASRDAPDQVEKTNTCTQLRSTGETADLMQLIQLGENVTACSNSLGFDQNIKSTSRLFNVRNDGSSSNINVTEKGSAQRMHIINENTSSHNVNDVCGGGTNLEASSDQDVMSNSQRNMSVPDVVLPSLSQEALKKRGISDEDGSNLGGKEILSNSSAECTHEVFVRDAENLIISDHETEKSHGLLFPENSQTTEGWGPFQSTQKDFQNKNLGHKRPVIGISPVKPVSEEDAHELSDNFQAVSVVAEEEANKSSIDLPSDVIQKIREIIMPGSGSEILCQPSDHIVDVIVGGQVVYVPEVSHPLADDPAVASPSSKVDGLAIDGPCTEVESSVLGDSSNLAQVRSEQVAVDQGELRNKESVNAQLVYDDDLVNGVIGLRSYVTSVNDQNSENTDVVDVITSERNAGHNVREQCNNDNRNIGKSKRNLCLNKKTDNENKSVSVVMSKNESDNYVNTMPKICQNSQDVAEVVSLSEARKEDGSEKLGEVFSDNLSDLQRSVNESGGVLSSSGSHATDSLDLIAGMNDAAADIPEYSVADRICDSVGSRDRVSPVMLVVTNGDVNIESSNVPAQFTGAGYTVSTKQLSSSVPDQLGSCITTTKMNAFLNVHDMQTSECNADVETSGQNDCGESKNVTCAKKPPVAGIASNMSNNTDQGDNAKRISRHLLKRKSQYGTELPTGRNSLKLRTGVQFNSIKKRKFTFKKCKLLGEHRLMNLSLTQNVDQASSDNGLEILNSNYIAAASSREDPDNNADNEIKCPANVNIVCAESVHQDEVSLISARTEPGHFSDIHTPSRCIPLSSQSTSNCNSSDLSKVQDASRSVSRLQQFTLPTPQNSLPSYQPNLRLKNYLANHSDSVVFSGRDSTSAADNQSTRRSGLYFPSLEGIERSVQPSRTTSQPVMSSFDLCNKLQEIMRTDNESRDQKTLQAFKCSKETMETIFTHFNSMV